MERYSLKITENYAAIITDSHLNVRKQLELTILSGHREENEKLLAQIYADIDKEREHTQKRSRSIFIDKIKIPYFNTKECFILKNKFTCF